MTTAFVLLMMCVSYCDVPNAVTFYKQSDCIKAGREAVAAFSKIAPYGYRATYVCAVKSRPGGRQ